MNQPTSSTHVTPCWIGPANWQDQVKPDTQHPYALRKVITIDQPITQAKLNITAAWRYLLYINGKFINHGPARCFPEHMLYDELDIAEHLNVGKNVIAVILIPTTGVPGYSIVSRNGLWCDGKITCNNQTIPLLSDTNWQIRKAEWINFHHLYISLAVGQQEHYDGQREPADWKTDPDLDVTDWQNPMFLGTHPTPPWWNLSPRPHRLLVESPIDSNMTWEGQLESAIPDLPANPAIAFNKAAVCGHALNLKTTDPIELAPQQIVTLDFGHTQLIRPGLTFDSAQAGTRLLLCYDIALNDRPTAMIGFGTKNEGFCDTVTLGQQTQHWQAIQPRGFRFMSIINTGSSTVELMPNCQVVQYPFDQLVTPQLPDQSLLNVWDTSVRTLRASCFDAIVDTCSREQMCWTLDACIAGEAAFHTFGETKLWRRCLQLIAQGIDEHGCPRAVVPSDVSFMVLFDQTMYWLISCSAYLKLVDDDSLIDEIKAPAERFLKLCASHMTEEKLYVPPNYSWHFVDWVPIPRQAYSLPINAMLGWATGQAMQWLDSDIAKQIHTDLHASFMRFYDPQATCFANHVRPQCEVGVENTFNHTQDNATHSLHGNAMLLHTSWLDRAQCSQVESAMLKMLANPGIPESKMGPGWSHIILSPLYQAGYQQEVLAYLNATYGRLTAAQTPTWPEGFAYGDQRISLHNTAHAWGASVNILLATMKDSETKTENSTVLSR
jgi:hypothetical protein